VKDDERRHGAAGNGPGEGQSADDTRPAPGDEMSATATAMPRLQIATVFLRIGALAFGGLGATVALIERELVDRGGALTREVIAGALTHTKLLPGSTVVQVVAYLGWRLGGWPGSAIATVCFILPSALLMLGLAYGYAEVAATPGAIAARRGVLAVVVALLLTTMFRLTAQVVRTPLARALAVGAFVIVAFLPNASPWVVISAGLIALVVFRDLR
jgi:chromate transporter